MPGRKPHPIKTLVAERGQTLREFAAEAGISPGSLNQVVNGHSAPWPALRARCVEALDVPEEALFGADDDLVAAARALAARTRRTQGLPTTVTDLAVLERIGRTLARETT